MQQHFTRTKKDDLTTYLSFLYYFLKRHKSVFYIQYNEENSVSFSVNERGTEKFKKVLGPFTVLQQTTKAWDQQTEHKLCG